MIGTGTSTDPYQITTVAELRQYIAIQGAYLKLMNDIDFNNDTVLWGWVPLYAACAELDGGGVQDNKLLLLSKIIHYLIL